MADYLNIAGRVRTTAADGVVAEAQEVKDLIKNKNQQELNNDFSTAIEAILLLIPSAASSLNQLADKAFVNSSIATASATFRGTYNLVSDLNLTVSATHAQIGAALAGAVSDEDNNDYAFVQVPTSDDTPTQIAKTERYKFNGTEWEYEYDLNNSGYTADQWASINSGITSALVSKLSALPTNAELTTALGVLTEGIAAINAKIPSAASSSNKLVDTAAMQSYITQVLDTIDATFNVTSTDGHVTVQITQVNGVITAVNVTTSDIASDADLSLLAGRVTIAEGNISTNAQDIANLQQLYNNLQQSAPVVIEPTDTWPVAVADRSATVIYRVVDRVNTTPQYYSDYLFRASDLSGQPVLMAQYDNAIDPRPKKGSQNLVTSGGVFDNMGALDVSELNATENPHTLATYADLSAALAAIPSDYRKGGITIKFVQSSDNKYVQYRLMSPTWSTVVTEWQGVDDEPIAGSDNLILSGGSFRRNENTDIAVGLTVSEDVKTLSQGTIYNGHISSNPECLCNENYIEVYPGKTYELIHASDIKIRVSEYNENRQYVQNTDYVKIDYIALGSTTKYIRLSALYSERGYGQENPVTINDYQDGDFAILLPIADKVVPKEKIVQFDNAIKMATVGIHEKITVTAGEHSSTKDHVPCFIEAGVKTVIGLKNITTSNTGLATIWVKYEGEDFATSTGVIINFNNYAYVTLNKNAVAVSFYWTSTVGSTNGDVGVEIFNASAVTNRLNIVAYLSNGADFEWNESGTTTIKLGDSLNIKHVSSTINFTVDELLTAASDVTGFSVDQVARTITFPSTGTMFYNTETRTVGFINSSTIADDSKYIVLFARYYSSVKYGLLIEYALRKKYNTFLQLYQLVGQKHVLTFEGNGETYISKSIPVNSNDVYRIIPSRKSWPVATNTQSYAVRAFDLYVNGVEQYKASILSGQSTFKQLDDYYDVIIPATTGVETITIGFRAALNEEVSFSIVDITATIPDGQSTIFKTNPAEEFIPKVKTLKKKASSNTPLVLLWFSDIHADLENLKRINIWKTKYADYIDDVLNTGDTIYSTLAQYNAQINPYFNNYDGANILLAIGNHDVTTPNSSYMAWDGTQSITDMYSKYIGRLNANTLGITQPANAATNGYCFYYKDYVGLGISTSGIRLIVIDSCITDADYMTAQVAWFAETLAGAKTLGYDVVVASHYMPGGCDEFENAKGFAYFNREYRSSTRTTADSRFATAIDSFITEGGKFVTWICGHTHTDHVGTVPSHSNQMIIAITTANSNSSVIYNETAIIPFRGANTKAQDAFNHIAIDTYNKQVKLVRVGYNVDAMGRDINMITLDYENKKVII